MIIDQSDARTGLRTEVQRAIQYTTRRGEAQNVWLGEVLRELEWLSMQTDVNFIPAALKRQKNFLEASHRTASALHQIGYSPDVDSVYASRHVSVIRWNITAAHARYELLLTLDYASGRFKDDPTFTKWYHAVEHHCCCFSIVNDCLIVNPQNLGVKGVLSSTLLPVSLLADFEHFRLNDGDASVFQKRSE